LQKVVLIAVAGILFSGCATLRKNSVTGVPEKTIPDTEIIEATIKNNISEWNFNISKAEIEATSGGLTTHFLAAVKFRKPDSVLLTVRSSFGTEVAKVLMTHDTLLINDRLNKELLIGKPGIRTLKYGISPDVLLILLGDLVSDRKAIQKSVICRKGLTEIAARVNGKDIVYTIDCRRQKAIEAKVEESVFSGEADIRFKKLKKTGDLIMPFSIELYEPDSKTEIRIEIERAEAAGGGKIEFSPGKNYTIRKLR